MKINGVFFPLAMLIATVTVSSAQWDSIHEYSLPLPNPYPTQITAGPDGALWFTSSAAFLGRITTAGLFTEYPYPGVGGGGIAAGPDHALWFTMANANAIGRMTTAGAFTSYSVPTANAYPMNIARGPDGALWFTEYSANKIGRITTAGAITEFVLPSTYNSPTVITPGPDGALWFIYNYTYAIARITTSGVVTQFTVPYSIGSPLSITAGPDGALWFTAATAPGIVGRITTAGVLSQYSTPGSVYWIASGPDGALWLTTYDGMIGRLTTSGVYTAYPMPTPSVAGGIAPGPDGGLWFTEAYDQPYGKIGRAAACGLGLVPSYAAGTLALNFDLSVMTPATWKAWLVTGSGIQPLWAQAIPATHPPRAFTFSRSVSPQGNVGVLSVLSSASSGILCNDMQFVNTGASGPTIEELWRQVVDSGIVTPQP